jgi:predicted lipid-binding transport protein (Tim44 family)/ribosomal protein L37E
MIPFGHLRLVQGWRHGAKLLCVLLLGSVPVAAARQAETGGHGGRNAFDDRYVGPKGSEKPGAVLGQPIGPLLFVAVLAGLVIFHGRSLDREAAQEREERRRRKRHVPSMEDMARSLLERDPAFSPKEFLDRCARVFAAFERACCERDPAPIRSLVSDAIYERFCLQVSEKTRNGVRTVVDSVIFGDNTIAQVEADEHFQTVTVCLRGKALAYVVNDAEQRLLAGSMAVHQRFVEYWTFVRRPGATTLPTGGLLVGNCPNCGTRLHLNQTGICGSCQAKVWSGRYDWVLTEITHGHEWRARPHHEVPGVATLSHNDPSFCLRQLHDRANAMFWRRIAAWQSGDVDVLRHLATDAYCKSMAEELRPDPDGSRRIPTQPNVGAVVTEGIICEPPTDRALIRINWTAGAERILADGSHEPSLRIGFRVAFLLLTRKHGAQGSLDDGLSSSHCRCCGAPETDSHSALCEHCGTPWADEERDWLLANVYREDESEVEEFRSRLDLIANVGEHANGKRTRVSRLPSSGRELIAWMVKIMMIDGEFADGERSTLDAVAAIHGVSEKELQRLVDAERANELEVEVPSDKETSQAWLAAVAGIPSSARRLTRSQKRAMRILGQYLGLNEDTITQTIRDAKSRRQPGTEPRNCA